MFDQGGVETHELLEVLGHRPVGSRIAAYLDHYGDSTAGELKLETVTIRDDPVRLIGMIRAHLDAAERSASVRGKAPYRQARRQLMQATPVLSRLGVALTLRLARRAVADRERLRLLRTYVFGIARDAYRACGHRLHELGVLPDPGDIYYLTIDEIAAYWEARAVSTRLGDLVAARRAEHDSYHQVELPNRIDSVGIPYLRDLTVTPEATADVEGNVLTA